MLLSLLFRNVLLQAVTYELIFFKKFNSRRSKSVEYIRLKIQSQSIRVSSTDLLFE